MDCTPFSGVLWWTGWWAMVSAMLIMSMVIVCQSKAAKRQNRKSQPESQTLPQSQCTCVAMAQREMGLNNQTTGINSPTR